MASSNSKCWPPWSGIVGPLSSQRAYQRGILPRISIQHSPPTVHRWWQKTSHQNGNKVTVYNTILLCSMLCSFLSCIRMHQNLAESICLNFKSLTPLRFFCEHKFFSGSTRKQQRGDSILFFWAICHECSTYKLTKNSMKKKYPPWKKKHVPWKSMLGRCISSWNSHFLRDVLLVFGGCKQLGPPVSPCFPQLHLSPPGSTTIT